jgi:hypothetical protein
MLSFVFVMPRIFQAIETSLSAPLTLNVPAIEPEVEPKIVLTAIDPTTGPWAWKSLLATLARKLSSVDIGVGEGVGVGVGEGVGVGVGVAKAPPDVRSPVIVLVVPQQAATDTMKSTMAAPWAIRRMCGNEGRCLAAAFGITGIVRRNRPATGEAGRGRGHRRLTSRSRSDQCRTRQERVRCSGFQCSPSPEPAREFRWRDDDQFGRGLSQASVNPVPNVQIAIGNLKAWLIGSHKGVWRRYLAAHLDEFVFRYNRRRNLPLAFRTLLGFGATREPTTYEVIRGPKDMSKIVYTPSYKEAGRPGRVRGPRRSPAQPRPRNALAAMSRRLPCDGVLSGVAFEEVAHHSAHALAF